MSGIGRLVPCRPWFRQPRSARMPRRHHVQDAAKHCGFAAKSGSTWTGIPSEDQAWQAARYRRLPGLCVLLLLALASCAPRPPLLEDEAVVLAGDLHLARDLLALSRELEGDPLRDRLRLDLVEGLEAPPRAFAGGWLLHLRRGPTALLAWTGSGARRGLALNLAEGDSLRLLEVREDEDRPGPEGRHRLLWIELAGGERRLLQGGLDGQHRQLAAGPAARSRWLEGPPAAWVDGEDRPARGFREGPGSWRLERARELRASASGWKLAPAVALDSPYRALAEFVDAARRGRWSRAAQRADLSRLLALPDGGWSRRLGPSLKLSTPELLERERELQAPPFGRLLRFEAVGGRPAWRVEAELQPAGREGSRWRLTRLEQVATPR
jgi:hypothetical protein